MTRELEAPVQWTGAASPGLRPVDLAQLGASVASLGLDVGGLVAEVQQMATQMALAFTPKVLERIQDIVDDRVRRAMYEVRNLQGAMGSNYVRRDQVMMILAQMNISRGK